MTRFGEVSRFLRNCLSLRQFFEGIFNIWQNCEHPFATFYAIGQTFIVVNGQILLEECSHLVTLDYKLKCKCIEKNVV